MSWLHPQWTELVERAGEVAAVAIDPNDAYVVLQTLVGAWPVSDERLGVYLRKA
ncbi:MAG: hypothetical protein H0W16_14820, partial [Actinobacteria bacterium]|nr:hypothetical protein [Actinomycetota bacterium]